MAVLQEHPVSSLHCILDHLLSNGALSLAQGNGLHSGGTTVEDFHAILKQFQLILKFHLFIFSVYTCVTHLCAWELRFHGVHMEVTGQLQELELSFHHVGLRN